MNKSYAIIYPYKEILYMRIQEYKDLSESDKMIKMSLWNLVGPYLVCKDQKSVDTAATLFFKHSTLGNDTLISITHRFDYKTKKAIWFEAPACTLVKYLENTYNLQIVKNDNGKEIILISNTDIPGELKVACWL